MPFVLDQYLLLPLKILKERKVKDQSERLMFISMFSRSVVESELNMSYFVYVRKDVGQLCILINALATVADFIYCEVF